MQLSKIAFAMMVLGVMNCANANTATVQEVKNNEPISVDTMDQFSVEFIRPEVNTNINDDVTNKIASATMEATDEPETVVDLDSINSKSEATLVTEVKEEVKDEIKNIENTTSDNIENVVAVTNDKTEQVEKNVVQQVETIKAETTEKITEVAVETKETVTPVVEKAENQKQELAQQVKEVEAKVEVKPELVITSEMLNSAELAKKFPLPAKPEFVLNDSYDVNDEDKENVVVSKDNGTYHVVSGSGFLKILKDTFTDDYKNRGVSSEQYLVALYRGNAKKFSSTVPIYPYADVDLVIPTVEQTLLEDAATYKQLFTKEGDTVSLESLPQINISDADTDAQSKIIEQKYQNELKEYEQKVNSVMEQRRQYLLDEYNKK